MRLDRAAVLTPALLLALVAPGCGGAERSPEAYCKAFYAKAAPIRQSYVNADANMEQNPLGGIVKVLSAPGDLASIFDSMVDHAPDEIKSDTVQVRDSFQKQQDAMGKALESPLGAIGSSLAASLTSSGAFQRVGDYLDAHCPVDSPLAQRYIRAAAH